MHQLAIVIPAYKGKFFEQTLESIARQSCTDFTLYIGDDASPEDLAAMVNMYDKRIDIKYKRFEENLGGEDLIAHWERCIDFSEGEEWIWVFSDDDIMAPTCVEDFYKALNLYPHFDLFHFDTVTIGVNGQVKSRNVVFPDIYQSEDFLLDRLKGKISSFAVEYVFKRQPFLQMGRFPKFDLGWGTDDALWVLLGKNHGIKTIDNAAVYWRKSEFNISSINSNEGIVRRRLLAQVAFAKWAIKAVQDNMVNIPYDTLKKHLGIWLFKAIKTKARFLSLTSTKLILSESQFLWEKEKIMVNTLNVHAHRIYFLFKLKVKSILKMGYIK